MKNIKLAILAGALVLAGCSDGVKQVNLHLKYITTKSVPITSTDKDAQAEVASAAIATSGSLEELSAIQMASQHTKTLPKPFNPRITGMTELASIDWNGPVQPIVKQLASASNYRLRVLGVAPAIPDLVIVNMQNQPIADILRNVMFQVQNKATIKVYPKSRVIELRYLPA